MGNRYSGYWDGQALSIMDNVITDFIQWFQNLKKKPNLTINFSYFTPHH